MPATEGEVVWEVGGNGFVELEAEEDEDEGGEATDVVDASAHEGEEVGWLLRTVTVEPHATSPPPTVQSLALLDAARVTRARIADSLGNIETYTHGGERNVVRQSSW